jgi:outer membrane biosynthesis protein TonB
MKLRERATQKRGGKASVRPMAMASSAPKRSLAAKKSAKKPAKKSAPPKKAPKKPAPAAKPAAPPKPAPAVVVTPRLATPLPAGPLQPKPAAVPKPPPPRPVAAGPAEVERRRAMTRRFFARLRSLEAIVGADLRKRGSVVLMQAVDHWYSEAASATATDVSITNAAKAVIAQL